MKLVMCGDGPERADAERLAAGLGVADCVEFVGKQPQSRILEYLSVADVLLLPSQTESFGLAALEGMACEVPVIALAWAAFRSHRRRRMRLYVRGRRRGRHGPIRAQILNDAASASASGGAGAKSPRHASRPKRSSRNTKSYTAR